MSLEFNYNPNCRALSQLFEFLSVTSIWCRNPCIGSKRCLSAMKFIGFSAISQSYHRSGWSVCVSVCSNIPYRLIFQPPSILAQRLATRPLRLYGIPLGTFRYSYLPATTSKIPSSPPLGPREFPLSYKGFAATYNISPSLYPCYFALPAFIHSKLALQ